MVENTERILARMSGVQVRVDGWLYKDFCLKLELIKLHLAWYLSERHKHINLGNNVMCLDKHVL